MKEEILQKAKNSRLSVSGSPERSCLITREPQPKAGLIRFVVSPEGLLVADLSGRLPGRGLYVTASKLLVAEALAKRAFSRCPAADTYS